MDSESMFMSDNLTSKKLIYVSDNSAYEARYDDGEGESAAWGVTCSDGSYTADWCRYKAILRQDASCCVIALFHPSSLPVFNLHANVAAQCLNTPIINTVSVKTQTWRQDFQ